MTKSKQSERLRVNINTHTDFTFKIIRPANNKPRNWLNGHLHVVLGFSHKSYDTIFGYYLPFLLLERLYAIHLIKKKQLRF